MHSEQPLLFAMRVLAAFVPKHFEPNLRPRQTAATVATAAAAAAATAATTSTNDQVAKFICVYLRAKSFRLTCLALSTTLLWCHNWHAPYTRNRPRRRSATSALMQLQLLLSSFAFVASTKLFVLFGACCFWVTFFSYFEMYFSFPFHWFCVSGIQSHSH